MTLSVAVTGHSGVDIYTRYLPGRVSKTDDALQREMVYNLTVPAGAGLHVEMLRWVARHTKCFKVIDRVAGNLMLPTSLHFLDRYKWPKRGVLRIKRRAPLVVVENAGKEEWKNPPVLAAPPDCLVIHYERTHQASAARESAEKYLSTIFRQTTDSETATPHVFVIMGDRMPNIELDGAGDPHIAGMHADAWQLLRDRSEHVAIICSATALRRAGAAISRRLSWEQSIEDTVAELRHCELLRALAGVGHLIVVFGMVAALHWEPRKKEEPCAQLVFAPNARNLTFRDKFEDGETAAHTSSVVGFMLREMSLSQQTPKSLDRDAIARALRDSLTLNMRWFDCGFPNPDADDYQGQNGVGDKAGRAFLRGYCDGNDKDGPRPAYIASQGYDTLLKWNKIDPDRILGTTDINVRKLKTAAQTQTLHRWQILRDQVSSKKVSRINLGIAICRFGHRNVLNRNLETKYAPDERRYRDQIEEIGKVLQVSECPPLDDEVSDDQPLPEGARIAVPERSISYKPTQPGVASLYVPIIEFGDLVAIERQEMESFRSIKNLMKTYVEAKPDAPLARRPISIAVFGAPGSGKSFAVKQIARSINETAAGASTRLETIECNVAQFRTVEDLGHAITRIASINNQQKIPLIFFDEFDCGFEGKPLGWLKYFLAPMQDSTFYGASQTISFGRAIFVFAGGVAQTLSDFDPYAKPAAPNAIGAAAANLETRKSLFSEQKGPDFVSRLRGHIDILSVNPDKTAVKDERGNPVKPILRRAFIIRGQIMASHLYADRDGFQIANIDEDVLYALLTVDRYRHGTRSIEAILQMCAPMEDGVIEKASLPSQAQLSMHVDAEEFMTRVLRGRFRRFLPVDRGKLSVADVSPPKIDASNQEKQAEIDGTASKEKAPRAKKDEHSTRETQGRTKTGKHRDTRRTRGRRTGVEEGESHGDEIQT